MSVKLGQFVFVLVVVLSSCASDSMASRSTSAGALAYPPHRPVFYDRDGNHLPGVDRVENGYRFLRLSSDAGSIGIGTWWKVVDGKVEVIKPKGLWPEVVAEKIRERRELNRLHGPDSAPNK